MAEPSITYEVIRRFIITKGFESRFGLQLLWKILNDTLNPCKNNLNISAEVKRTSLNNRRTSSEEDSCMSDVSENTVLFNTDSSCAACDQVKERKNPNFGSSSCVEDERVKVTEENQTNDREEKKENKNILGSSQDEDRELEKLLRMTDFNPNARANTSTVTKADEKVDKEKKESQAKEPSLMDCLESKNDELNSDPDSKIEEKNQCDFISVMNSQIKKVFLLTSDESHESSGENDEGVKPKRKKRRKKEKKETFKKSKPDGLSEFSMPNLTAEKDDEEEEKGEEEKEEEEEDEEEKEKEDEDGEVIKKKSETESILRHALLKKNLSSEDDSDQSNQEVCNRNKKRKPKSSTDTETGSDNRCGLSPKTESSPSKGRKNIKKIIKKEYLKVETKQALKMEAERKKRVNERQKLFEELFPSADSDSKFILDFDAKTGKELVVVDETICRQLKPHQTEGVRFMWNCCFESSERVEEDSGSGCVLAHCMGLGKTLQVITLVHTVLTHDLGVRTVMILCPLITIRNWTNEFENWQKDCKTKIKPIDLLPCRSKRERAKKVKSWSRNGGVLVIGYDMFRSLVQKDSPNLDFRKGLLDPGPDLVVCDEGHVLKNNNSILSKFIVQMKTLRRIVLTGTPLQNNLMEYYCMVQFVKPNILGTVKEFRNRFEHPITNGQFEDSTQFDVTLMKRRAHVLHTMMEGFIQRFGYHVLTPFLPEKQEYVISIALTETQENIYRLCIDRLRQGNRGLLTDFHWMQKIWTHPKLLVMQNDNVDDGGARNQWVNDVGEEEFSEVRSSGKMLLLFRILRQSKEIGDKVLVFSQSLKTLNIIESFLQKANAEYCSGVPAQFADSWVFGEDYFRLDGSTNVETRDVFCHKFNNPKNKRFRLFLVSTRAGGLGINLVAANRVVVFDVSWNPSHDVQGIFRVYRFGQKKPCFIYRFLAAATMEEKIYRRQVTKLSLAHRILDERQIERHYTMGNLQELYTYDPKPRSEWKVPRVPKDNLFAEILASSRDIIVGYHEHDSLLENKEEEELTEEDRRAAWEEYEKEKLSQSQPPLQPPPQTPFPYALNGAQLPIVDINHGEDFVVMNSWKSVSRPQVSHPSEVIPKADQMCKIVNVRTLKNDKINFGSEETNSLIQVGKSFGLKPYKHESFEKYHQRVDETLKSIYPWKIPRG